MKDGTAQGVAKARHYEALWDEARRLFFDPHAAEMYPGAFVQAWLGTTLTRRLYDLVGPGILEMLLIRTKWLDDQVMSHAPSVEQMIILGAGYDTRGFRLELPREDFRVWEVDRPEVQRKKTAKIQRIAKKDSTVARLANTFVRFVPVDFNTDDLHEKLREAEGFALARPSLVLLEGVTQYIPKSSTADTLRRLKSLVAPGSTVLLSYVDQDVFDEPSKVGPLRSVENLLKMSKKFGEPWISAWTEPGFAAFMADLGFDVLENSTARDYNESYMVPLGRGMAPEETTSVERFVVARLRG